MVQLLLLSPCSFHVVFLKRLRQMRKLVYAAIFLGMVFCWASSVLAENELGFEIISDFFSKYIWRGQNLNDDYVFQTGGTVNCGNLSAGIWGNLDLTNINDRSGDFSEVDYFLDYSDDLPGF